MAAVVPSTFHGHVELFPPTSAECPSPSSPSSPPLTLLTTPHPSNMLTKAFSAVDRWLLKLQLQAPNKPHHGELHIYSFPRPLSNHSRESVSASNVFVYFHASSFVFGENCWRTELKTSLAFTHLQMLEVFGVNCEFCLKPSWFHNNPVQTTKWEKKKRWCFFAKNSVGLVNFGLRYAARQLHPLPVLTFRTVELKEALIHLHGSPTSGCRVRLSPDSCSFTQKQNWNHLPERVLTSANVTHQL